MSLSDYIRGRRMLQVAFDLQRCDARVLDVAPKYGYTSSTALNRTSQRVHNIPPTAAKNIGRTLHAYPPMQFSVNITGGSPIAYHIAERGELRFMNIRIHLCEEMEEDHKAIFHSRKETIQGPRYTGFCQLSDTGTDAIFDIDVYEDPDHIFYYITVATSEKIPSWFHELRTPAVTWTVLESKGNFKENAQDTFRRLHSEQPLSSGYEYTRLPDVETYPVQTQTPYDNQCSVWIVTHKEEEKEHGI